MPMLLEPVGPPLGLEEPLTTEGPTWPDTLKSCRPSPGRDWNLANARWTSAKSHVETMSANRGEHHTVRCCRKIPHASWCQEALGLQGSHGHARGQAQTRRLPEDGVAHTAWSPAWLTSSGHFACGPSWLVEPGDAN